jgi:hypothetical protein
MASDMLLFTAHVLQPVRLAVLESKIERLGPSTPWR